jgi:hypothetical protein
LAMTWTHACSHEWAKRGLGVSFKISRIYIYLGDGRGRILMVEFKVWLAMGSIIQGSGCPSSTIPTAVGKSNME